MITYVDTSGVVKLLIDEPGSQHAALVWDRAEELAAASPIVVEARAALAAAARDHRITATQHRSAKRSLDDLVDQLAVVAVTEELIAAAAALAEREALRGYDAVHLAAAVAVGASVLLSADDALCAAADRHGMHIANPLES